MDATVRAPQISRHRRRDQNPMTTRTARRDFDRLSPVYDETRQPLDLETIAESVKRTSRLVIASDDVKRGGVGAEISASIIETCFDYLDAPINRVACPDTPIPFSPQLEQQYMPNADRVVQAVETVLGR